MPDRERDLERELRKLGSRVEYPRTPDLAGAARRRIDEEDETRTSRRGLFWLPALSPRWAVAAMFVVVLAVPALSPAVRDELSGLFAVGGASYGGGGRSADEAGDASEDKMISESAGQAGPKAATAEGIAPESGGVGQAEPGKSGDAEEATGFPVSVMPSPARPGFAAERIPLQEARARAGDAPLLLPRTPILGAPDEAYAAGPPDSGGLALIYRTRFGLPPIGKSGIGLILTELPSGLGSAYLGDEPDTVRLQRVRVGTERGYWVPGGRALPETAAETAPPGGVLLWDRDERALRLESNLGKKEAIRIAESVR